MAKYSLHLRRPIWRYLASALAIIVAINLLFYRVGPALQYTLWRRPHPALRNHNSRQPSKEAASLSVNLIVASVYRDDTSWLDNLNIPNLQVLRYVSDDTSAQNRPPAPKGREALMYMTYLYNNYDNLADVNIFIHAEETPWHVEGTLLRNTTFALSQLDLQQVIKRGYFNLRVTWRAACPAWIDTSKTFDNYDKAEEPYMKEAWKSNFGDDPLPEKLGGPCCSQFAVSKDAIRSRPREQYRDSAAWLVHTPWRDHIAGRVWEHMWPWLFKKETKDCAPERSSLCQMYSLCFQSNRELDDYKELWEERERLKTSMSFFRAVWSPQTAAAARQKMDSVDDQIEEKLQEVYDRGKIAA